MSHVRVVAVAIVVAVAAVGVVHRGLVPGVDAVARRPSVADARDDAVGQRLAVGVVQQGGAVLVAAPSLRVVLAHEHPISGVEREGGLWERAQSSGESVRTTLRRGESSIQPPPSSVLSSATSFSAERNVNTAPPSVQHSGPEYFPSPMQLQSTSMQSPVESHSGGVWAASAYSSRSYSGAGYWLATAIIAGDRATGFCGAPATSQAGQRASSDRSRRAVTDAT